MPESVKPVTAAVPGDPTAVVGTADGRWAFASVTQGSKGEITVLALAGGAGGTMLVVRTVAVPQTLHAAFGMSLTHDGKLLLVAGDSATAVMNVDALEDGQGNAVAGVLADAGSGQFEVAVSADDRYAYVTDENTGTLSVFDLAIARQRGFSAPGVAVGTVQLAEGAVGVALSPDGKLLYVSTFGAYGPHGQLWAVDTAAADSGAGERAVVADTQAGCQPVRVAVSPDGATIWVTALQSNALLAFSAGALRGDPSRALEAVVPVGSEPVGLALVDHGRIVLVGNSDRGLVRGTGGGGAQTVSVLDTAAALAHRPALIGSVPAGLFPRDVTIDPASGAVLLANFNSGTVEEFSVPNL